jgi:hypothetical protein
MPELTNFDPGDYQERIDHIIKGAEEQIADLAEEARLDLGVIERAAVQVEIGGIKQAEVERMWVAEFSVEGHALEHAARQSVNLLLPDSSNFGHGRDVKLAEFTHRGQYLATGRYRVITSIIRLDGPS